MTGDSQVLGAATGTTAAGVALLPNTGGNTLMTVVSIIMMVAGGIIVTSFVATKIAGRFTR